MIYLSGGAISDALTHTRIGYMITPNIPNLADLSRNQWAADTGLFSSAGERTFDLSRSCTSSTSKGGSMARRTYPERAIKSGRPIVHNATSIAKEFKVSKSIIRYHIDHGWLKPDLMTVSGWELFYPETVKAWAEEYRSQSYRDRLWERRKIGYFARSVVAV